MDVDVTLSGKYKDSASLQWPLMSKVTVHRLTDGDSMREGSLLANMQKIGFREVRFRDGYNYGVRYTLTPSSESEGGATVLRTMGLGTPLAFSAR